MSEENIDVVRRGIDGYNRRDMASQLAVFHRDAEIDWSRSRGPLQGVYRGHGELETVLTEFWSTFADGRIEAHEFRQAGPTVVVPNTAYLRGRDGIEVTARSTFVYTVENGQVTRLQLFQELNEALEAAGLPE